MEGELKTQSEFIRSIQNNSDLMEFHPTNTNFLQKLLMFKMDPALKNQGLLKG